MKTITANTQLQKGTRSLQETLIALAQSESEREWAFPGGDRATCPTYSLETDLGEMLFAIPAPWEGRQAHLFKLNHEGGTLFPDAEINIPYELNRRISGVLVTNEDGMTMVFHRGTFTAYRGRVPREISLEHFRFWLREVDDSDRTSEMIAVTSTDSPSIRNDIAEFVHEVKRLKERVKADAQNDPAADSSPEGSVEPDVGWRTNEEYEGDKSYTPNADTIDYVYLHGPLCNALDRKLNLLVGGYPGLEVGKHQVDLALVDKVSNKAKAIFEVKTSASMSPQLYTAFGQLAYYKHRFGTTDTKLYLVLPESTSPDFLAGDFFAKADIQVIFGEAGSFRASNGKTLEEILRVFE